MIRGVWGPAVRQAPLAAVGLALAATAVSAQVPPVGQEFQVNTHTLGSQSGATIGRASDNDFVVAWTSSTSAGTDTDSTSVQARRFEQDGSPLGDDFQVNTYTTSDQVFPAIAVASSGSFVVVWESEGSDGTDSGQSIQARRFASNGVPVGSQFQVNTSTAFGQYRPDVATAGDSAFVVVWQSLSSLGSDDDGFSIQGQRYSLDGMPLGGEFQVNSHTVGGQYLPAVGVAPNGSFVIVWESVSSAGSDQSGASVQGQRYASTGTPAGGQFQVNAYTTADQGRPSIGVAVDGSFVVSWQSDGSDGSDVDGDSVQAQAYDSSGGANGAQFQVNSYTTAHQYFSASSIAPDGSFAVTWSSQGSPGPDDSGRSVQAQRYSPSGLARGVQFQVNTYTTLAQTLPDVVMTADGHLAVVWNSLGSNGSDSSDKSIQARLWPTLVFSDGFESGDTSTWSVTVP